MIEQDNEPLDSEQDMVSEGAPAVPEPRDPDKGEVLSIWATLQAMTEMAQLTKEKEAADEAPHE
jgi:hypothetical protein